jgi:hypothetical protein
MKKNIFIIGIISLFIGLTVLPLCSASTSSTVLSTSTNDPPPPIHYFFIKAQVEGTVSGLQKGIFRVTGHGPIDLTVNALSGTYNQYFYGSSWTFSAIFTKLITFDPEHNYIKGTVYFCRFYLSD